ncbi:sodium:solute symporter [Virgibacillus oceani]
MYLITFLVYLIIVIGIGVYFKKYNEGVEDFAVAGRSLGVPVLLGTLFSTTMGGATVVGWTGSFYTMGIGWWFSGLGAILGILAATFILAEKFRRLEQFTVPDMLALRYDRRSGYLSSIMIIIGDVAVITVQILSITGILVVFIGLEELPAMIIGVLAFTVISLFGGMKGVAITDAIQAVLVFLGLMVGVIILFYVGGGINNIVQALPNDYFSVFSSTDGLGAFNMAMAAFGTTAVSQSIIFARVFSAKDAKTAKTSLLWLVPAVFLGYLFTALLGYSGRGILGADVVPDQVFPTIVTTLLPPFVGALLLVVVIAALVTTTNSIILSTSINVARDFYQQLRKGDVSSKELQKVSQISVVIIAVISFLLAFFMPNIIDAIVFAYTMYAAGLLIPMYVGYLWKGATATAGMLSIIGGGGTALLWYILNQPFGLPPMVPSLLVSLVLIIVISFITEKPSKEQLKSFDI